MPFMDDDGSVDMMRDSKPSVCYCRWERGPNGKGN